MFMLLYIYVYVYTYVYIHVSIYIHIYMCIQQAHVPRFAGNYEYFSIVPQTCHGYIYIYIYVYVHEHMCIYLRIFSFVYFIERPSADAADPNPERVTPPRPTPGDVRSPEPTT